MMTEDNLKVIKRVEPYIYIYIVYNILYYTNTKNNVFTKERDIFKVW